MQMKQLDEVKEAVTGDVQKSISMHTNKMLKQVTKTEKMLEDINQRVFNRNYWWLTES